MNHRRIEFLKVARNYFASIGEKQIPTEFQVSGLRLDEFQRSKIPKGSVFDELRYLGIKNYPMVNFRAEHFPVLETIDITQEDCHKIGCASIGSFMTGAQVAERIENRIRELS